MKVVYLVAGAGGMYCGSCLRDNRLAATLIEQGRDVVLVPLYTPIRTDEEDVSTSRVYFGGINVYLLHKSVLFRGLPGFLKRALDAPSLLRRAMRLAGDTQGKLAGELSVDVLRGTDGGLKNESNKLIDGLRPLRPDLINLPNLMFSGLAAPLKAALRVPIVCTLSGEDLFLDRLPDSYRMRCTELIGRAAKDVDAYAAMTNYFAAAATTRFGLPAERVHVVPMGIRVDDIASAAAPEERSGDGRRSSAPARRDPRDNTPFTIGYLARICPEKGLANLCDALARLRASGRECRLRAAGYLGRGDRGYLDAIRKQLEAQGGGNDFEYVGEVDRAGKRGFLQSLDLFSVPTVYHEAKGLYILEALAAGVPVVQPRHGSFPELVESTGGGVLYDPCDANGLADAIAELMDDPPCRRALARCGQATVRESYTDTLMADRMWALYKRLCHCS